MATSTETTIPESLGAAAPRAVSSATVWGAVIFAVVNLMLLLCRPLSHIDPESLPSAHTWVWWAAREYQSEPKAPEIVILGASLLMHPISRLDADYLNRDVDYVHHHRSEYLADALQKATGNKISRCFNFALPGAMMSDDYMVLRAMLSGKRKPSAVILGLGVRDFSDSLVSCPAATPPFRYLKRYANIDDLVDLVMPQMWQRFDYWLGKAVYAHGKKLDAQVAMCEATRSGLGKRFAAALPPSRLVEADPERNAPGNMRAEVEEGWFVVRAHQQLLFEDNTREYKRRFRSPNTSMFDIQEKFLEKFMADCRRNDIRVLLVNIPVTPANRALVPAGNYERFVRLIHDTAARWNTCCVDLGDDTDFVAADFYDTCHMNASGGRKFLDKIVQAITGDLPTMSALQQRRSTRLAVKSSTGATKQKADSLHQ